MQFVHIHNLNFEVYIWQITKWEVLTMNILKKSGYIFGGGVCSFQWKLLIGIGSQTKFDFAGVKLHTSYL